MKQLIHWLIGEGKFKLFIYWLIGEKAGFALVGIWNWLWGIPVESGGKIAVEVAEESLEAMQRTVTQLTESVATVVAAYQKAQQKYADRLQEFKQAENQALFAHQRGNEEAARLAMSRAIAIERLLPKIAEQVAQAEKVVIASKEKLYREREKLEAYKTEMQNLKALAEINEALAAIAQIDSSLNLDSAQNQFENAQSAVEGRYLQVNARAELSESHVEKLQTDLDRLTLDEEISRRLAQLDVGKS
ncbi:MAG: PspA/IM30 family protein [Cyanosarcina radialis HA8281-LM2]|jgi:phage shock protein A|nr:PspA/IM30 family protein [Cyanosarcina radialis HA8281-LM2]